MMSHLYFEDLIMKVFVRNKLVDFTDNSYPIKVDIAECFITDLYAFEAVLENLYFLRRNKTKIVAGMEVDGFRYFHGTCSNVGLDRINKYLIIDINVSFNSLDIKKMGGFEKLENFSYPVGGSREYNTSGHSRTMWINPRRWEYVEFLINALEQLACQLR